MLDNLKAFVSSPGGKHVQFVYLNEKSDYMLTEKPGFDKVLTRDQILALPDSPKPVTEDDKLADALKENKALAEKVAALEKENANLKAENELLKEEAEKVKSATDGPPAESSPLTPSNETQDNAAPSSETSSPADALAKAKAKK